MKKLIAYYFRHRRRLFRIFFAFSIVALFILLPDTVFAAEEPAAATKTINDTLASIGDTVAKLLQVCSMILWPVLMMIGSLLDNELIFGGAMGERLLSVWVQIRNLVNILFVVILLAIAIYNILGLGEEGGSLPLAAKTALPKFVLALIAVNFSFLAVKVVLDFTNVVTGIVFALPSTTIDRPANIPDLVEQKICGTNSMEVPGKARWCSEQKLTDEAKNFFGRFDRTNVTLVYAIKFGRAIDLKFIENGLKDIAQLTFNIIFNFILYMVYAVSFIVLFLVLLLRLVTLWVGVVLSPFLALGIVLPNLKQLLGGGDKMQETFVKNAIAPVKIGLVLSIGYIMLDGLQADKSLHGTLLASSTLTAIDPFAIPTSITDLQQLLIAFASVAIIWMGVFAGVEGSTAQILTNGMKGALEGAGKWVAKLPMYAQVIPVGSGTQSIQQLLYGMKQWKREFEAKYGETHGSMATQNFEKEATGSDPKPAKLAEMIKNNPEMMKTDFGRWKASLEAALEKGTGPDKSLKEAIKNSTTPEDVIDKIYRHRGGEFTDPIIAAGGTREQLIQKMNERASAGGESAAGAAGATGGARPPAPPIAPLKPTDAKDAADKLKTEDISRFAWTANADPVKTQLQQIAKIDEKIAERLLKLGANKEMDIDPVNKTKITELATFMTEINQNNIKSASVGSADYQKIIDAIRSRKGGIADKAALEHAVKSIFKDNRSVIDTSGNITAQIQTEIS